MPIAFVNAANGEDNSSTTHLTIATGTFSCTAGNFLYVFVRHGTLTQPSVTISDTAGNSFTQIGTELEGNLGASDHFFCANCKGNASNVVTATFGSAMTFCAIVAAQFSGITTIGNILDQNTSFDLASPGTSVSAPPITTTSAIELVCAGVNTNGPSSVTAGTGFTIPTGATTPARIAVVEYQILASAQSVTASMTFGQSSFAGILVGSFLAASDVADWFQNTNQPVMEKEGMLSY